VNERLHSLLMIPKRPHRFALSLTRPPLLSSATRHEILGPPGCARLTGANARPPYGIDHFFHSYRLHSSNPGPGTKTKSRT